MAEVWNNPYKVLSIEATIRSLKTGYSAMKNPKFKIVLQVQEGKIRNLLFGVAYHLHC